MATIQIRKYRKEDEPIIYNMLDDIFAILGKNVANLVWSVTKAECNNDFSDSVVITVDDEIAGFYVLYPNDLPPKKDILPNMRGIQGIVLGVSPKFQNMGLGKILIDHPKKMGYDYVWGEQIKELGNINHWLKRRKLYADLGGMYITYEIFNDKKNLAERFLKRIFEEVLKENKR